jgi:hypothetical protein
VSGGDEIGKRQHAPAFAGGVGDGEFVLMLEQADRVPKSIIPRPC